MKQDPRQSAALEMAKREIGLREKAGAQHEAKIVGFFAEVGHDWVKDDETAWCAAFVGAMLERAGLSSTRKLNARSYTVWGQPVPLDEALPGDVAVFSRGDPNGWQGHVAFYMSHGPELVSVLGGNQRNSVSVAPYKRSRLLSVRRMPAPDVPRAGQGRPSLLARLIALLVNLFRGVRR